MRAVLQCFVAPLWHTHIQPHVILSRPQHTLLDSLLYIFSIYNFIIIFLWGTLCIKVAYVCILCIAEKMELWKNWMDIRENKVYVNICLYTSNVHSNPTWIQENMCCLNNCQNKQFPCILVACLPYWLGRTGCCFNPRWPSTGTECCQTASLHHIKTISRSVPHRAPYF